MPGLTSASVPCKSFEGYRGNARHGFILGSVFAMDSLVCATYPFVAGYGTSKDESTLRGAVWYSAPSLEERDSPKADFARYKKRKEMKRYVYV